MYLVVQILAFSIFEGIFVFRSTTTWFQISTISPWKKGFKCGWNVQVILSFFIYSLFISSITNKSLYELKLMSEKFLLLFLEVVKKWGLHLFLLRYLEALQGFWYPILLSLLFSKCTCRFYVILIEIRT